MVLSALVGGNLTDIADERLSPDAASRSLLREQAINLRVAEHDLDECVEYAHRLLRQFVQAAPDRRALHAFARRAWNSGNLHMARAVAAYLSATDTMAAVALMPEDFDLPGTIALQSGSVLNLVLEALPQPDDSTPWERIADFRQDDNARRALRRIRRWLADASERLSGPAAVEELQYLIDQYTEYMNIQ